MIKQILAPTDLFELSRAEVIIYHVVTANEMLNLGEQG
jgi:hypothetical protein